MDNSENSAQNNANEVSNDNSMRIEDLSQQYLVLDEANASDENCDDSLSENEIDEMLEQDLPPSKRLKAHREQEDGAEGENSPDNRIHYKKTVLDEKGVNHFEVLPNGWVTVTHASGMPVYLHRESRVCTFGKPYFIGPGSARKHRVPLSAIPCLAYERALVAEKDQPDSLLVNGAALPNARVITSQENDETTQIGPQDLQDYCRKKFRFKEIEVIRFNSWPARRRFERKRMTEQRPTLPEGSKLIMCPIKAKDGKTNRMREWIMNPNGKTYVCILHDYVQRALKEKPVYTFKELENASTPYMVVISINGVEYGKGVGASKKLAKMEAAKATLEILIPEMKDKIEEDSRMTGRAGESKQDNDLSFFDAIKIEDPRVMEFCQKTTEPLPHTVLLTCLQRNFGLSEPNIKYEMKTIKHSKNEFTMTVGEHSASVICQSKRDGKQRASQAILQALHPHIQSWGSLLRLYGNHSVKSFKEKKVEEQEITALQSKGVTNGPNYAILNKLWEEMDKLRAGRSNVKPIGVFVPPKDITLPPSSGSDLHNLQL